MRGKAALISCAVLLLVLPMFAPPSGEAAPRSRVAYWLMADVIRGAADPVGTVGVQTNVFKPGEEVIFRARVLDITNGQDPGRAGQGLNVLKDMGLKVTSYLEDGRSLPMVYGRHPAQASGREQVSWFWTASWKIPTSQPPGRIKWWVIASDKSGGSTRFDPIGAGTNLPPIALIIEKR